MSLSPRTRRLVWLAVVVLVLGGGALAVRFWAGGYAVRTVLEMAGASEIRFQAVRGTPWHLEVEGLSFRIETQTVSARRVTLDRPNWWMASLGAVRVEGLELPVVLDGSDVNPWNWTTYDNAPANGEAVQLPLTTMDLDGHIIVRMASLPDMPVAVKLEGRPKSGTSWIGSLVAESPGFRLAGSGSLLRAGQELEFQVHSSELDLAVWSQQIQRLVTLPGAPWKLEGKLTAVGEGNVTAKRFASTARVSLRGGRMRVLARDIAVEGAEADLEFSDLWKYRTKSGELRLGELRVGRLAVRDIKADVGLWGAQTIIVNAASGRTLGGTVAVAPFRTRRDQRELILKLEASGLDAAQILSLAPEAPAQVGGRFNATLPLRILSSGVRFEPGTVTLASGGPGVMQLNPSALLRTDAKLDDATTKTLKAAGNVPLRLQLHELRLDIRSPDLPLGSSARVSLSGESESGPVAATLNVNGSIERYLEVLR